MSAGPSSGLKSIVAILCWRMPSMSWILSSNAESVSDRAKPVRSVLEILGMKVGAAIAWPGRFTGA